MPFYDEKFIKVINVVKNICKKIYLLNTEACTFNVLKFITFNFFTFSVCISSMYIDVHMQTYIYKTFEGIYVYLSYTFFCINNFGVRTYPQHILI